jgi:fructose-1,6-bisphosphatase/inositol monophosphatase family enzyme
MRVWDYSAPKLIVEEAGGRCTTFEGAEPIDSCSVLSTNGALHDEMLHLLS